MAVHLAHVYSVEQMAAQTADWMAVNLDCSRAVQMAGAGEKVVGKAEMTAG